jgi:hypothetical protein
MAQAPEIWRGLPMLPQHKAVVCKTERKLAIPFHWQRSMPVIISVLKRNDLIYEETDDMGPNISANRLYGFERFNGSGAILVMRFDLAVWMYI